MALMFEHLTAIEPDWDDWWLIPQVPTQIDHITLLDEPIKTGSRIQYVPMTSNAHRTVPHYTQTHAIHGNG